MLNRLFPMPLKRAALISARYPLLLKYECMCHALFPAVDKTLQQKYNVSNVIPLYDNF